MGARQRLVNILQVILAMGWSMSVNVNGKKSCKTLVFL